MPDATKWSDAQVRAALATIPGWDVQGGTQLAKTYTFNDFVGAMAFVNRVAELAERAAHHPDILVRYRQVTLTLSTHSAGGITEKDVALAKQIDAMRGAA